MRLPTAPLFLSLLLLSGALASAARLPGGGKPPQVRVAAGALEGQALASGVRAFWGVPFAAPPLGARRWQPPQPAPRWAGVRTAKAFGPRPMQLPLFSDMNFRSREVSEDCLYLNVWAPARAGAKPAPVLVYFYGGGFVAGDASELRYDGEAMARRGIVTVTVNYRLGVFGFLAHPELSQESARHAAGNYGLLDQCAALRWVRQNIAAFGGDPARVTIAGESAGSMSVSAQMASPLAQDLFAGAIGESGSLLNSGFGPVPLATAEQAGLAFAKGVGAPTLAALRALPAAQLLAATGQPGAVRFTAVLDNYFFTKSPAATFAAGEQARVPLLVGWNSAEGGYQGVLGDQPPTLANYRAALQTLYGAQAGEALRQYPAATDADVTQAATDLAGDRFIAYSTWKWADAHAQTSGQPVYRYLFSRPRPALPAAPGSPAPTPPLLVQGATHSAEIEYALGNLATNKVYAWTSDDYKVSETMQGYFASFIKTGNPNGAGLPAWPAATGGGPGQLLHLDVTTRAEADAHRARYVFLDQAAAR